MSTSHMAEFEDLFMSQVDIDSIPEDDRERVIHELQVECELARIMIEYSPN